MNTTNFPRSLTLTRHNRDWSHVVFAAGSLFFVVRLLGSGWRQGFPVSFPDSYSYLEVAKIGPFALDFWTADRPAGLPLVLWSFQSNIRVFIVFQTMMYIAAACFLFQTILLKFRNRSIAWTAIAVSAVVLSHYKYAMWNLEILAESLIFTTLIFSIALLMRATETPTKRNIGGLAFALLALLLLRDVNLFLVGCAIVGIVLCLRHKTMTTHRTFLVRIAISLVAASVLIFITQSQADRFQYGVINNVGLRILPNSDVADRIFGQDNPLRASLDKQIGKTAWDDGEAFLTDPSLEPFRDWVRSSGPGDIVKSFITESSFWKSQISNGMSIALNNDFKSYDRFNSSERLIKAPLGVLIPQTPLAFVVLMILSVFSLALLAKRSRTPGIISILFALLCISFVYLIICIVSDAVEVPRHSSPAILLASLLNIFVFSLLIDTAISPIDQRQNFPARLLRIPKLASISIGALLVMATTSLVALEFRTQDWDPSFARTIIERVGRFGGTYYQNGIWHHGPIDALLYDIPRFFTSFGTYWFGVALIVLGMSALIAYSIFRVSTFLATRYSIALALSTAVFFHFSISSSDYAGVIYSRNTTTTLLVSVFAFSLTRRPWSSQKLAKRSLVFSFFILGLAVQTMVSAIFTAVVVGLCVIFLHRESVTLRFAAIWSTLSFFTAIATAPAWYFFRNSLDEFWANWWVMARYMSTATNRSFSGQFSLAWDKFYEYYTDRPILFVIIVLFLLQQIQKWRLMTSEKKIVNVTVFFWFIAAWVELALSQRYSSHYFVIPSIPTSIMLAIVLANLFPAVHRDKVLEKRNTSLVPAIVTSIAVLFFQCSDLFWSGIEGLSRFQSISQHQQFVSDTRSGESKTIRAVLDLASSDNDGLLAWTMFPWTYLEHQRVPATRLSWKSFMLGEIYLAGQSPNYVLPDTWDWFAADMSQANPQTYLHPKEVPFVEETPFAAYVKQNFALAMETEKHNVGLHQDMWKSMTSPSAAAASSSTFADIVPNLAPIQLASQDCSRIDLVIQNSLANGVSSIEIAFQQSLTLAPQSVVRIDPTQIQTLVNGYSQHSQQLQDWSTERLPMSIFVGSRSAAVVINGKIATAVRLKDPIGISLSALSGAVTVDQTATTSAPYLNGCS